MTIPCITYTLQYFSTGDHFTKHDGSKVLYSTKISQFTILSQKLWHRLHLYSLIFAHRGSFNHILLFRLYPCHHLLALIVTVTFTLRKCEHVSFLLPYYHCSLCTFIIRYFLHVGTLKSYLNFQWG